MSAFFGGSPTTSVGTSTPPLPPLASPALLDQRRAADQSSIRSRVESKDHVRTTSSESQLRSVSPVLPPIRNSVQQRSEANDTSQRDEWDEFVNGTTDDLTPLPLPVANLRAGTPTRSGSPLSLNGSGRTGSPVGRSGSPMVSLVGERIVQQAPRPATPVVVVEEPRARTPVLERERPRQVDVIATEVPLPPSATESLFDSSRRQPTPDLLPALKTFTLQEPTRAAAPVLAPIRTDDRFLSTAPAPKSTTQQFYSVPSAPRFEFAIVIYPETILVRLLHHLEYYDFRSLRVVSKAIRTCIDEEAKELILQRYLGPLGYRSFLPSIPRTPQTGSPSSSKDRRISTLPRAKGIDKPGKDEIVLDLRDLDAFQVGLEYSVKEFALFAKQHAKTPLPTSTLRIVRASTRAWNRVVLRIRLQYLPTTSSSIVAPYLFSALPNEQTVVYKMGRAPTLRVWIPTKKSSSWMDDDEVVECEKEVWRSGVWARVRRGDLVHNTAIGDFG